MTPTYFILALYFFIGARTGSSYERWAFTQDTPPLLRTIIWTILFLFWLPIILGMMICDVWKWGFTQLGKRR